MKLLCSNLYIDESEGWADDARHCQLFVPRKQLGEALVMDCLGRHPDDSSAPPGR